MLRPPPDTAIAPPGPPSKASRAIVAGGHDAALPGQRSVPRWRRWSAASPVGAYRLAAWRRRGELGPGRLTVHSSGIFGIALRYTSPDPDDHSACLARRVWAMNLAGGIGPEPTTLRERACLTRGDVACEYVVTWTRGPRRLRLVLAALAAGLVAIALALAVPAAWMLVPVATTAAYLAEHRRVGRADRTARLASASAFRWLVERALAGRPSRPTADAAERGAGSEVEPIAREDAETARVHVEQEDHVCHVTWAGRTIVLRGSRGLALLARLVENPGTDIHVQALDAMTASNGSAAARERIDVEGVTILPLSDAGEILDKQARTEYRRRLAELRTELADAENCHDGGRAAKTRAEIDALEQQLRSAIGLGNRSRRASSDVERRRVAVTRAIRAAIAGIERHYPELGTHLTDSVRTGYICTYSPRMRYESVR